MDNHPSKTRSVLIAVLGFWLGAVLGNVQVEARGEEEGAGIRGDDEDSAADGPGEVYDIWLSSNDVCVESRIR